MRILSEGALQCESARRAIITPPGFRGTRAEHRAGSLALIGLLLWWLVSPWWLLLTGWIGAGLLFSGVTGHCPMAAMLAQMPWNRRR